MKRVSAIDIGTNTILMLIADIDSTGEIHVVRDEHVIARLGKGVDEHRMILPETFERVAGYLSEYKRIHRAEHSQQMIACGTSALRDAANRKEFLDFVHARLGIDISILSGDEEAELTYIGSVSEFVRPSQAQRFVVLDIGGGSTEIVVGEELTVKSKSSLDIGSVRLTERFLKTSPPLPGAIEAAKEYVRDRVRSGPVAVEGTQCIGVAGTLTTLAAIDLQLSTYERMKVSGHILTLDVIQKIFDRLKGRRLEELKAIPQILPQRADIILAGILILIELMKRLGVDTIAASDRGLRYGVLMKAADEKEQP